MTGCYGNIYRKQVGFVLNISGFSLSAHPIATVCCSPLDTSLDVPPEFFVVADGGLGSQSVYMT